MRRIGLDLLRPTAGETILEIGCGTGHCLVSIAEAVGPKGMALGLDLSDKMLEQARATLAKGGVRERAKLRRGDAVALPYADESIEGVFMSFTLELFDTPEIGLVLRECRRVLRPNGRIVVVAMSKVGPDDPLLRFYEWTHKHFPKFVDCRPIYAGEALKKAGFVIKKSLIKRMWVPVEIVLASKA